MPIDTVIFDLGGVMIDWNPRYLYRKVFGTEDEMEWFLSNVCHSEWNALQDGGRDFEDAIDQLVPIFPDYEREIRMYYGRWEEMLGGAILGTIDIFDKILQSNKCQLYALTNWSHQTFPIAFKTYDFLGEFKGILVSGEEKMKKPDAEIYYRLLEKFSLDVERCVFIDDSLANIKAADRIGFTTIHFKDPNQLQQEISKLIDF